MDYEQAVSYVLGLTDLECATFRSPEHFDMRRMEELMALTGNPHLGIKAVHVAGTKGKGSTSALIASALTASGFRTGLYTSPHLHSIRERIQIDGQDISEAEFASLVENLRPILESYPTSYGFRSTFEVL
ncbi:MAG: bifunctional folylpolyglutamate synthase/dihydrofolate synthase, partial [Chloroflexota bacterium]